MSKTFCTGGVYTHPESAKWNILSPRLKRKFAGRSSWEIISVIRSRFDKSAEDKSQLNWMTYLELNLRLPELLLMRVDKMSMANSIEARVPFLDHHFVRHALSIPPELKTRGGELKHILKRAVHSIIPEIIINRKKQGFLLLAALDIGSYNVGS